MTTNKFRMFLLLYLASIVIGIVMVFFIGHDSLPEPAVKYLEWWNHEPQSVLEKTAGWVGLSATFISIISVIALYFKYRWARLTFLIMIVVLFTMELLMDYPVFQSPMENFFDSLAAILAGVIIALSYWSPISKKLF